MVSKFYFSDHLQFLNFMLVVHKKNELFLFAADVAVALDLKEAKLLKFFFIIITLVRNKCLSLSQRWYQSLAE